MTLSPSDITLTLIDSTLGAIVGGVDIGAPLPQKSVDLLREAWLERLVLVFRGQSLTDSALTTFSRYFGTLDQVPGWDDFHAPGDPHVLVISNVVEAGRNIGVLGDGEAQWHTDMSYIEKPPTASVLYACEVPPKGGDTYFMNMYAAYDALPSDWQTRIQGCLINHDKSTDSSGQLRPGFSAFDDVTHAPGTHHPMARKHPETGRTALYLGRRLNASIVGLAREQSEAWLDEIWQLCLEQRFIYRHRWEVGDVLIWDNRCSMHRRDSFDPETRRIMHRTQIKGSTPSSPSA